jgi:hypothetical protein
MAETQFLAMEQEQELELELEWLLEVQQQQLLGQHMSVQQLKVLQLGPEYLQR